MCVCAGVTSEAAIMDQFSDSWKNLKYIATAGVKYIAEEMLTWKARKQGKTNPLSLF